MKPDRLEEWGDLYRPLEFEITDDAKWLPKYLRSEEVFARKQKPKDQLVFEEATVIEVGDNRSYVVETLVVERNFFP